MFRPHTPEDISEEDFKKYVSPRFDLVEEYIKNFVIPDYIAFFIASGYRYCAEEDSLEHFINSALCFFNVDYDQMKALADKDKIFEILKIKFGYIVVNEEPLQLIEDTPEN